MRGAGGEGGGSGELYYNSSPATFRYFAFYQLEEEGFTNIKKSSTTKGQVSEERGIEQGRKILTVFNWLNDFYPKDDTALTLKVIDIFFIN